VRGQISDRTRSSVRKRDYQPHRSSSQKSGDGLHSNGAAADESSAIRSSGTRGPLFGKHWSAGVIRSSNSCSQAARSAAGNGTVKSTSTGISRSPPGPKWNRSRAYVSPPRARMNITAQSVRPKHRAKVASSVPLGSAESAGWVCTQIRPNCSGRRPRSICSSKKSATASSSN
jgi:hypothetical protein